MTTSLQGGGAIPEFQLRHRIKLAREYAGMHQQELADVTGLSRSAIAQIELGKSTARRSSISLIAFATGVSRDWLENGESPAGPEPSGGDVVRHQGIEPRTHCLSLIAA